MDDINMTNIASCDGLEISRIESSLDNDVTYLRLDGFTRVIFN